MDALKHALRRRFAQGEPDAPAVAAIAAAIETAAQSVETTMMTETTGAAVRSRAAVHTPKAAGYAAQLGKHFAHKIPAHFENAPGRSGSAPGCAA